MNIAANWPGQPADLTSPAGIDTEARRIAEATERRALAEQIKAAHSQHVWRLIRQRALTIIHEGDQRWPPLY